MEFIITEEDIFKYLVYKEDGEEENIIQSAKWFLKRVPFNIFNDEFYVIYKAIEMSVKYDSVLTMEMLMQFLELNKTDLLTSTQISVFNDEDKTDNEKQQEVIDLTLTTLETLIDLSSDIETNTLKPITEMYIKTWCTDTYNNIINKQQEIMREGYRVGRNYFEGIEGAKHYHETAYRIIEQLYDEDSQSLSSDIDTSSMSYEQIKELSQEEEGGERMFKTGITQIDGDMEYSKGELLTLQAGSGVGKTRTAIGMVCYPSIKMYKRNVLYVSLEQKSTRIMPMFYARHISELHGHLSGVSSHTLMNENYPVQHKPIVEQAERDFVENPEYGRIRIRSTGVNADEIKQMLEEVWDSGFHFDIVCLDYFGLLQSNGNARHTDMSNAINYLKDACKNFKNEGFFGILVHQLTKEAEEALLDGDVELATKSGGSETQYVPRASDYILTLHQDARMKQLGRMRMYVGKMRSHLRDNPRSHYDVATLLGTCTFYDLVDGETS